MSEVNKNIAMMSGDKVVHVCGPDCACGAELVGRLLSPPKIADGKMPGGASIASDGTESSARLATAIDTARRLLGAAVDELVSARDALNAGQPNVMNRDLGAALRKAADGVTILNLLREGFSTEVNGTEQKQATR